MCERTLELVPAGRVVDNLGEHDVSRVNSPGWGIRGMSMSSLPMSSDHHLAFAHNTAQHCVSMPSDRSPPLYPRRRSRSRSPVGRSGRDRSPSPPRHSSANKRAPKELSMYKKSAPTSSSTGSFTTRRDPLDRMPERRNRDKEDVPSRYGGQRGSSSRGGDYEQRDADRSRGHGRDGRDNEDLRDGRDRQDRKERREETSRETFPDRVASNQNSAADLNQSSLAQATTVGSRFTGCRRGMSSLLQFDLGTSLQ